MKKNLSLNRNIKDDISNKNEPTASNGESLYLKKDCKTADQIKITGDYQPTTANKDSSALQTDCQHKAEIKYINENEATASLENLTNLQINHTTINKITCPQQTHQTTSCEGTAILQIHYKPTDQVNCINENQPPTSCEYSTLQINSTQIEKSECNISKHKSTSCGDMTILHIDIPQTCPINCLREDEAINVPEDCTALQTECKMSGVLSRTSSRENSLIEENVSVVLGSKTVKFHTQISIGTLRATNSNIHEGMRIIVSSQDHIIDREEPEPEELRESCSKFFNSQTVLILGYGLLVCTVSTVIVTLFMFIQKVQARVKGHHQE